MEEEEEEDEIEPSTSHLISFTTTRQPSSLQTVQMDDNIVKVNCVVYIYIYVSLGCDFFRILDGNMHGQVVKP